MHPGIAHADGTVASRPDWATPVAPSFNLYRMSPTLFRSALPHRENLDLLRTLKIGTVVSFIRDDDRAWAGDAPIRLVSLPIHADRVDDDEVLEALRIVKDAEGEGLVLMHCKHGVNRTGLMAAMYRIVVQGWSREDALAEMHGAGFGAEDDMAEATAYVRRADIAGIRTALEQGEPCTSRLSGCYAAHWLRRTLNGSQATRNAPN